MPWVWQDHPRSTAGEDLRGISGTDLAFKLLEESASKESNSSKINGVFGIVEEAMSCEDHDWNEAEPCPSCPDVEAYPPTHRLETQWSGSMYLSQETGELFYIGEDDPEPIQVTGNTIQADAGSIGGFEQGERGGGFIRIGTATAEPSYIGYHEAQEQLLKSVNEPNPSELLSALRNQVAAVAEIAHGSSNREAWLELQAMISQTLLKIREREGPPTSRAEHLLLRKVGDE
jgi:hypothetical protein